MTTRWKIIITIASLLYVVLLFGLVYSYNNQKFILEDKIGPLVPSQNPIYSCPVNGWVNCMPIVVPEKQYQCQEPYLSWVKKNCPHYEGIAR